MHQRITPDNFWATALGAMAEAAPYVAPALKAEQDRLQAAQEPAHDDRIHRVEVCLQDIIAFEQELEDGLLNKIRKLERIALDQQRQIRNLQAWVEDEARGES